MPSATGSASSSLVLIGASEFLPDRAFPSPQKTGSAGPEQVRAAYDGLKIDAGYLSQAASAWFGDVLPQGFNLVRETPVVRVFPVTTAAGSTCDALVVFFPPRSVLGTAETESPTPALLGCVLDAARAAAAASRAKTGLEPLVIGISPWGFQAEREALPQLAGVFHLLLGAGDGAPLTAETSETSTALLWSRAGLDGKDLTVLDFFALPADGAWNPATAVKARDITLGSSYPGDPAIDALLHPFEG